MIIIRNAFHTIRMHTYQSKSLHILLLLTLLFPKFCQGYELVTAYANIIYQDKEVLSRFNSRINLGRLRYYMPQTSGMVEEEIKAKVDLITHRVQTVLDMFPKDLRYNIYLLRDRNEVQRLHETLYREKKDFLAFYSPRMNTVYISPERLNISVLAHEIGHVVVENFFEITPPERVHEVLAQFAEKHLGN